MSALTPDFNIFAHWKLAVTIAAMILMLVAAAHRGRHSRLCQSFERDYEQARTDEKQSAEQSFLKARRHGLNAALLLCVICALSLGILCIWIFG